MKASDEMVVSCAAKAGGKVKGFAFVKGLEKGGGCRLIIALATNAMEVHSVPKHVEGSE